MDPTAERRLPAGQGSLRRWQGRSHRHSLGEATLARTGRGVISVAMAACLSTSLHAQSGNFSGTVALSSQLVDRGLAMTPSTPILQGAASWISPAGWSLGLSAGVEVRSPGHLAEAIAQASRFWSLSSDWQVQGNLLYYNYHNNGRTGVFDRAETGVNWIYRDVLTLGLSANWFIGASDHGPHGAADIGFHWPLARHFSFSAGAGVAQTLTTAYGSHSYGYGYERGHGYDYDYDRVSTYRYGHAGLVWSYGPWRAELDRIVTDLDWNQPANSLSAPSWVATISRSF